MSSRHHSVRRSHRSQHSHVGSISSPTPVAAFSKPFDGMASISPESSPVQSESVTRRQRHNPENRFEHDLHKLERETRRLKALSLKHTQNQSNHHQQHTQPIQRSSRKSAVIDAENSREDLSSPIRALRPHPFLAESFLLSTGPMSNSIGPDVPITNRITPFGIVSTGNYGISREELELTNIRPEQRQTLHEEQAGFVNQTHQSTHSQYQDYQHDHHLNTHNLPPAKHTFRIYSREEQERALYNAKRAYGQALTSFSFF
ncbi:hypothetical protein BLNAU_1903 [Blattamonas nauphoetae]|uniref:Uncharacterized protein n=1 Tax=Blattamonas nauphoetae TaxID=2049346 RepID=A0ABQ9YHZ5_9EUKA|nr:hypothetical protein BLNAU_1903 [Blattamonas nauphoetae]